MLRLTENKRISKPMNPEVIEAWVKSRETTEKNMQEKLNLCFDTLTDIPGVGEKMKEKIITHFKNKMEQGD